MPDLHGEVTRADGQAPRQMPLRIALVAILVGVGLVLGGTGVLIPRLREARSSPVAINEPSGRDTASEHAQTPPTRHVPHAQESTAVHIGGPMAITVGNDGVQVPSRVTIWDQPVPFGIDGISSEPGEKVAGRVAALIAPKATPVPELNATARTALTDALTKARDTGNFRGGPGQLSDAQGHLQFLDLGAADLFDTDSVRTVWAGPPTSTAITRIGSAIGVYVQVSKFGMATIKVAGAIVLPTSADGR
jgi:hypothetical protein